MFTRRIFNSSAMKSTLYLMIDHASFQDSLVTDMMDLNIDPIIYKPGDPVKSIVSIIDDGFIRNIKRKHNFDAFKTRLQSPVILLARLSSFYMFVSLKPWAKAFITYDEPFNLKSILDQINSGQTTMSATAQNLLKMDRKESQETLFGAENIMQSLTPMEIVILHEISIHKYSHVIARRSHISRSRETIERHRKNIKKKLNIDGKHGLLIFAREFRDEINTLRILDGLKHSNLMGNNR